MTQPTPSKPTILRADYDYILRRAAELETPIPPPGEAAIHPKSFCTYFPVINEAAKDLEDLADKLLKAHAEAENRRQQLSRALQNAVKFYRIVDEAGAKAVSSETAAAIMNGTSLSEAVTPGPVDEEFGPAMLGALGKPIPDFGPGYADAKQRAWQMEQYDFRSFESFAAAWEAYPAVLRAAQKPFQWRDFDDHWHGEAAPAAKKNFQAQYDWLDTLGDRCRELAAVARKAVEAHRWLLKQHVCIDNVGIPSIDGWSGNYQKGVTHWDWARINAFEKFYTDPSVVERFELDWNILHRVNMDIQKQSTALMEQYPGKAGLPITIKWKQGELNPPDGIVIKPPDPWKPGKPVDKKEYERDANKDHKKDDITPIGPDGGLPSMPSVPSMPSMPSTPPKAEPAPAMTPPPGGKGAPGLPKGGGVKAASFGGAGVPATPLQPWADDGEASRPAAAGPGRGNLGRGVPGGGAMGGGMGMGGAPGHGAGKDGGKGKRVQGDDDESLYTEDRAWTEGVVGLREARDVPNQ
jgi:hypothetical protein